MNKPRVLCFLDNPLGRDTEILLPITYTLETYYNVEIKYKSLWDIFYIKLWKPDIILLPNIKGHHMYLEIATFCTKNNVTVLAHESEGNFRTDGSFEYWGYNKKKKLYQEWLTCWSNRTKNYLQSIIDENDHHKLILTGGTGFDRYTFDLFMNRQEFLIKYGFSDFKKVIGYAGWGFGKIHGIHADQAFRHMHGWKPRNEILEWIEKHRKITKNILEETIKNNPDILFIFKKHPKENFESDPTEGPNEMNQLLHYKNVCYFKNEEPIENLINISDLWLAFESTTVIESWILRKPTIHLNTEQEFPRSLLHRGSLKTNSAEQLQEFINELYKTGKIHAFDSEDLKIERNKAIENSIGFSDGKNHLRTAFYFKNVIPKKHINKKVKLNLRHLRLYLLMHWGRFFYNKQLFMVLPKFKKTIYVFENRKMPGLKKRMETCYANLANFHSKNGINKAIENDLWEEIID